MKPRLVAALCASLVVLGACGSDDASTAATDTVAPVAPVTDAPTTTAVTTTTEASTTTEATTTTEAAPDTTASTADTMPAVVGAIVPGADPDVDAIVQAYLVVFDSSTPYADKEPYLEDAAALKATIDNYEAAGSAVGGIALVPTSVTVSGDTAAVVYDVQFAGTAVYNGLDGDAIKVADTWVVPRAKFCDFMAQAQNPCP